ncbi:hypothetical protein ACG83_17645 [Frankia sp. R43]|nr:hypothetical protein ACG83_17645 [Frankia sp. R43]
MWGLPVWVQVWSGSAWRQVSTRPLAAGVVAQVLSVTPSAAVSGSGVLSGSVLVPVPVVGGGVSPMQRRGGAHWGMV